MGVSSGSFVITMLKVSTALVISLLMTLFGLYVSTSFWAAGLREEVRKRETSGTEA